MTTHEWLVTGFTTFMAVGTWVGAFFAARDKAKLQHWLATAAKDRTEQKNTVVLTRKLLDLAIAVRDDHVAKIYSHVRIVKAVAEQTGNTALVQQADELLAQEKR